MSARPEIAWRGEQAAHDVSLVGGKAAPPRALDVVLWDALAGYVNDADPRLRVRVASLRSHEQVGTLPSSVLRVSGALDREEGHDHQHHGSHDRLLGPPLVGPTMSGSAGGENPRSDIDRDCSLVERAS